jgi:membrane protein implicated in regulation of membrane protease activity
VFKIFSKGTVNSIVGKRCTVVESIDNNAGRGEVRINNQIWAARSVRDDITYKVGDHPKIVAVEGVMLVCK